MRGAPDGNGGRAGSSIWHRSHEVSTHVLEIHSMTIHILGRRKLSQLFCGKWTGLGSVSPKPVNATWFGSGVSADVIKLGRSHKQEWGGLQIQHDWRLRESERSGSETQRGEKSREDGGTDSSDSVTSKERQRLLPPPKAERDRDRLCPEPSGGAWPCWHLDSGLLASRTVREKKNLCDLTPPVGGN